MPAGDDSRARLPAGAGSGGRKARSGGHQDPLDPGGIDPSLDEVGVAEDPAMERDRGLDSLDDQLVEGPPHDGERLVAGRGVDDQLADERVVVGRDRVADLDVRVPADARAARDAQAR